MKRLGFEKMGKFIRLNLKQGKQVRVVEFRDITALREEEDARKKSEEQYNLLAAKMPLGLALHEIICDDQMTPVDYRFLSINKGYEVLTGLKKEDIIEKTVLEVLPNTEKYWIEKFGKVALNRESIQFEGYSQEIGKYFRVTGYSPIKGQFVVIVDDITERKRLELEIIKEKETLSATLKSIGDAVITTDANGWITSMNPVASKLTGWSEKEAVFKPFNEVFNITFEDKNIKIENPIEQVILTNNTVELANHTILISRNGSKYFIEDTASPIKNEKGEMIGVVLVFRDVTQKTLKEEEIIHISKHDFLTKLPNRRYFDEKLKALDQDEYYPLFISMIDLDGLKLINDAYGHQTGDLAIIEVASQISKHIRKKDFAARIGGDEFVIIYPNTTIDEYKKIRDSILEGISANPIKDIHVSLSFGHAIKMNSSESIDEVLIKTENDMYARKALHGRSIRNETILALYNSLKDKHSEERIHSDRVSQYCRRMGEALNLGRDEIRELEFAGKMHDIGKITIPDNILHKEGKLNQEEWSIMKNHTVNGYNILRSADKYSRLAEYALTHHERWDGKGYPSRLKGEDIPLISRIICVCDAYEAMTADRKYRKAVDHETAAKELYRCAGTQFDEELVNIFIEKEIYMKGL